MLPFDPREFHDHVLKLNGIEAVFGVPDSTLSGLLSYFAATQDVPQHIVLANEGGAVGLAVGYYLSTRKVALCYLQNSGYSNALNPLQSLAAKEVFGTPMLLMIGWRGKPGIKDEPQHALIGPRLLSNLEANDIPYEQIPDTIAQSKDTVARLIATSLDKQTPVALIVPPGAFSKYEGKAPLDSSPARRAGHVAATRWLSSASDFGLSREQVVRSVLAHMKDTDVSVSSLGGNSRELYMVRKARGESLGSNFFCIGAMGHAFAVANGVRMGAPSSRRLFCIDGDGSFLMHVGNNAVLADISQPGIVHVVIFNGVHSSTGSQPLTISRNAFLAMAEGLGYQQKFFVDEANGLERALQQSSGGGSALIVVVANTLVSDSLPRPSESPYELRDMFMKTLA
ncbi:phosphonopyruvate decarboxylase [Hirsutella rhossiliensis]|uniref:Phosphonopyruvate decarboxylase n=1 Tax=Hirsutella rhossiliensis TaxID=111463 RepID=A0A9P8MWE6_9HYPO|nr:phosphonopyruvate decarboxylase [Hirsutella rhossiliensis]KAH0963328.1 phosphonopyruvate decarboxylase [Hirsutella rhossiliensis]